MEIKKFVAFSCTHCPLQDNEAVEWLINNIIKHKPDVVLHLGDGHESSAASRWDNETEWPLSYEFEVHNAMLKKIRKASPKHARMIFLPGNHDANILSINRIDKNLRDLCDYRKLEPELMEHWEQPCKYIYTKKDGAFRLGQVTFSHGFEANQSSDEFQSIILGMPYGLFISGHTHRCLPVTQALRTKTVPLPYWYANAGCLRELDPEWMHRRRSHLWGQACVIGDVGLIKSPRMSQSWNAETLVYKMREEV